MSSTSARVTRKGKSRQTWNKHLVLGERAASVLEFRFASGRAPNALCSGCTTRRT